MGKTGERCQPVIRTASKVIPTVLATRVVDVEESDGRDRGELNRTLRRVGVGEGPGDALVREEELEGYGAGRCRRRSYTRGPFGVGATSSLARSRSRTSMLVSARSLRAAENW
jgi:hypothetical protein